VVRNTLRLLQLGGLEPKLAGNFEFGMSRVIKSLDPFSKKLGTQTWFYAKRCFCALIEQMAKQMITVNDQVMEDIIEFLEMAEVHGK
jgi:tetratricopeptide repeat protein 30